MNTASVINRVRPERNSCFFSHGISPSQDVGVTQLISQSRDHVTPNNFFMLSLPVTLVSLLHQHSLDSLSLVKGFMGQLCDILHHMPLR